MPPKKGYRVKYAAEQAEAKTEPTVGDLQRQIDELRQDLEEERLRSACLMDVLDAQYYYWLNWKNRELTANEITTVNAMRVLFKSKQELLKKG